jgi:hypothetical protein
MVSKYNIPCARVCADCDVRVQVREAPDPDEAYPALHVQVDAPAALNELAGQAEQVDAPVVAAYVSAVHSVRACTPDEHK